MKSTLCGAHCLRFLLSCDCINPVYNHLCNEAAVCLGSAAHFRNQMILWALALTANTVLLCRSRSLFFSHPPLIGSMLTPVIFERVFFWVDDRNTEWNECIWSGVIDWYYSSRVWFTVFLSLEQWPQGLRKMWICDLLCGTANYLMLMYFAVCLSFHSYSSLYWVCLSSQIQPRCSISSPFKSRIYQNTQFCTCI